MIVATLQILNLQILFIKDHRPVLVFPGGADLQTKALGSGEASRWNPLSKQSPQLCAIMCHNLAGRLGQLAPVTVGTMQGRPLSHSSGVKGTTF